MNRLALLALALVAGGCPSSPVSPADGGADGSALANAPQLWLAPNGSELKVKLSPIRPNPF